MEDRNNLSRLDMNIIQNIVVESREKITITGVVDVLSFDDLIVIIETELGLLTIKGNDLRINKLNLDNSEVIIEGKIISFGYSDEEKEEKSNSSLFTKLFK